MYPRKAERRAIQGERGCASGKPVAAAAPASPLEALAGSGIFGALFGGGKKNDSANQKENDGAVDGTALLQALLKAGNKK